MLTSQCHPKRRGTSKQHNQDNLKHGVHRQITSFPLSTKTSSLLVLLFLLPNTRTAHKNPQQLDHSEAGLQSRGTSPLTTHSDAA